MRKVFIFTQLYSGYDVNITLGLLELSEKISQDVTVVVDKYSDNKLLGSLSGIIPNSIIEFNEQDIIACQDFVLLSAASLYAQRALPALSIKLNCMYIENVTSIGPTLNYLINEHGLIASCEFPTSACIMTITDSAIRNISSGLRYVKNLINKPEDLILVGGRSLGSFENFARLIKLAEVMQAEVGATYGAINSGFAPENLLVGVSGKSIDNKIYIGFGVSGAISHTLALAKSRKVIAINNDSNAAILAVADYAVIIDVMVAIEYFENVFAAALME